MVVSCLDHMKVDEIQLELPIRKEHMPRVIARMSDGFKREDFMWTKVTGGIWCCPELEEDRGKCE